jgi:oxygen-independent coproporphyrinogen-3 oxidase
VLEEWRLYRQALLKLGVSDIPLTDLHLGGGTPTFLSSAELDQLVRGILDGAQLTDTHEFSVEADPRVTTAEHLKTLAGLGFRRLSLGIQDFDPKVQEVVHRVQSIEQVRDVTDRARALGFTSVNYDLIYGLPFQTKQSVEATIRAVVELRPDRIAFYGYAHVPWIKPSQRRFTEADLPDGNAKRELYELGRLLLEQAGYAEVGMDHFALKTDSLWVAANEGKLHRNFMGYTPQLVTPLIGLGVSAIGDSWSIFAQNEKVLETYQERVARGELPILRGHVLDAEDQILRRHILNLMTRFSTSWDEPSASTEYLRAATERLSELVRDGLVVLDAHGIRVLDAGKPFLRNICMAFDARLARRAPDTALFSRTV